MPLNALGWTTEEDENLAKLVQPHPLLYNVLDPSRKNILARETTWTEIAGKLAKPVEECKKRWRGIRDGYMRCKRMGTIHKTKNSIFDKLQFLEGTESQEDPQLMEITVPCGEETILDTEQQVITDNQEYYEITVVEGPPDEIEAKPTINLLPKPDIVKKVNRKNAGRKKSLPMPRDVPPIKILPKPLVVNGPKIVRYIDDSKTVEPRSQVIDKLIEKVLKENTNEIDVFFRSMAASVKKLQPNLIPKVKMEVCNVIAKYEMQSFDKSQHS